MLLFEGFRRQAFHDLTPLGFLRQCLPQPGLRLFVLLEFGFQLGPPFDAVGRFQIAPQCLRALPLFREFCLQLAPALEGLGRQAFHRLAPLGLVRQHFAQRLDLLIRLGLFGLQLLDPRLQPRSFHHVILLERLQLLLDFLQLLAQPHLGLLVLGQFKFPLTLIFRHQEFGQALDLLLRRSVLRLQLLRAGFQPGAFGVIALLVRLQLSLRLLQFLAQPGLDLLVLRQVQKTRQLLLRLLQLEAHVGFGLQLALRLFQLQPHRFQVFLEFAPVFPKLRRVFFKFLPPLGFRRQRRLHGLNVLLDDRPVALQFGDPVGEFVLLNPGTRPLRPQFFLRYLQLGLQFRVGLLLLRQFRFQSGRVLTQLLGFAFGPFPPPGFRGQLVGQALDLQGGFQLRRLQLFDLGFQPGLLRACGGLLRLQLRLRRLAFRLQLRLRLFASGQFRLQRTPLPANFHSLLLGGFPSLALGGQVLRQALNLRFPFRFRRL